MKTKTLGEIARSHGFDNLSDYINAVNKEIDIAKNKSFNVGDSVKLKDDFKPTHFGDEKILPKNTAFIITEKSDFTLDSYQIKLEGYEIWFFASVFEYYQ